MTLDVLTFDLDGTLVDTLDEIAAAVDRTLGDLGLPPQPRAVVRACVGHGIRATLLQVLARVAPDLAADAARHPALFTALEAHYAATSGTCAAAYPGAARLLDDLRGHGVRTALVTNKEQRFAARVLDHLDLAHRFELVVGGDTLPWRKPDGRVLQQVVRQLGGRPGHSAHLGDSAVDVASAHAAGVAAWAVSWGYGDPAALAQARPAHTFDRLADVGQFVLATSPAAGGGADALPAR